MRKRSSKKASYTPKEIGAQLASAVQFALHPAKKQISDERIKKLKPYTLAIMAPLVEHTEEGLLSIEELIAIFCVCANYLHLTHVLKTLDYEKVSSGIKEDS